jgi:ABC-type taurine transport system ATPase subunit
MSAAETAVVYDQRASVSQDRELIPWAAVQDVEYGLQAQGFAVAFLEHIACFARFLCE